MKTGMLLAATIAFAVTLVLAQSKTDYCIAHPGQPGVVGPGRDHPYHYYFERCMAR
jgi:hypothetical protein